MGQIVYYEGEMVPEGEVRIPLSDRGLQCGDGAYATIQVNEGVPLFLETHLQQLAKQCASFNLLTPPLKTETIRELIEVNHATEGIWRLKILITGGDGEENYLPERMGRVIAYIHPFIPSPLKRLRMGLFSLPYSSCHAGFKSLAHLNRYYVMQEARCLGFDDCVTFTERRILLEAAFGNLFWVKKKTFYTCDPTLSLHFGVTIKKMVTLADQLGFNIEYVKWRVTDIPLEVAAFRVSTMQGICPIQQIDQIQFTQNETMEDLFMKGYEAMIEKEKRATCDGIALLESCLLRKI